MTKLALALIVILAGCTDRKSDERPDAAVEKHVDAAVDGPRKMIDADTDTSCSEEADTCPGDSICIASVCEPAFGRLYDITELAVTLSATDPDGNCWDIGCAPPDMFVTIAVDDVVTATTPVIDDQFSVTFAGPFPIEPVGGGSLSLGAYDDGFFSNTLEYICEANPVTADQLRTRHLMCSSDGNTMSFVIEPR